MRQDEPCYSNAFGTTVCFLPPSPMGWSFFLHQFFLPHRVWCFFSLHRAKLFSRIRRENFRRGNFFLGLCQSPVSRQNLLPPRGGVSFFLGNFSLGLIILFPVWGTKFYLFRWGGFFFLCRAKIYHPCFSPQTPLTHYSSQFCLAQPPGKND